MKPSPCERPLTAAEWQRLHDLARANARALHFDPRSRDAMDALANKCAAQADIAAYNERATAVRS